MFDYGLHEGTSGAYKRMKTEIRSEFHNELIGMDRDLALLKIELSDVVLTLERIEKQKQQLLTLIQDKDRMVIGRLKAIAKEHNLDPEKSSLSFNIGDMSLTEI